MTTAGAILEPLPSARSSAEKRADPPARPASFVSVIIPAKNASAYIREAIDSAMAQGADVGEIIVIDDGSSDDTAAIVRSIRDNRLRLIANVSAGVSAARNLGARTASGRGCCSSMPTIACAPAQWLHWWQLRRPRPRPFLSMATTI